MMGALFFMASCGGEKSTETANTETENHEGHDHEGHDHGTEEAATTASYAVDVESSNVKWTGSAIGVYSHFGNINIQEGILEITGNEITGGSFTIDMTSIDPQDDNYGENNPKEYLVSHLSKGDFFLVEEYPTSKFEITSVAEGQITGNLTIRDKTNEETITLESMDVTEDGSINASGKLTFDRQQYDVAWQYEPGKDLILSDDIELEINLVAKK